MRDRRRPSASREGHREWAEARRQRRARADAARQEEEAREAALQAALKRQRVSAADVALRALLTRKAKRKCGTRLAELFHVVEDEAPRLLDEETIRALRLMADFDWVRPASTWTPEGRGYNTVFRSLAQHLFGRYPMPAVLWTAFRAHRAHILARVAVHVGAGGSLYDAVKTGLMPVPLTRRMCHDVLNAPAGPGFLAAVRWAQAKAAGGSRALCREWMHTEAGGFLHGRAREEFWQTVLAWLCGNPTVSPAQVGPLVDYLGHRADQDPRFTMKGRSLAALIRGMEEWHRELSRQRPTDKRAFNPCGLEPTDLDRSRRDAAGRDIKEIWHMREILDSTALIGEGRAMGHCVASYAWRIDKGQSAIWTLTLEDDTGHWRRLTVEVHPSQRRIVQARGRFNAAPQARDLVALRAWAGQNNLVLAVP